MKEDFMVKQMEIDAARRQIEEGNREIKAAMNRIQGSVDQAVEKVGDSAEMADHRMIDFVDKTRDALNSYTARVDKIIQDGRTEVDQTFVSVEDYAQRFVGVFRDFQKFLEEDGQKVIDRVEKLGDRFRASVEEGIGSVDQLFDHGEEIVGKLADPSKLLQENPRVVLAGAVVAGVVLGIFFRRDRRGLIRGEVQQFGKGVRRVA